jgi:hypothetical protein
MMTTDLKFYKQALSQADAALCKAVKCTEALQAEVDRKADYVVVQFEGENGVTAELGDLDKNIIHFENKVNDNHGVLGVSQVGINNRSGIVILKDYQ